MTLGGARPARLSELGVRPPPPPPGYCVHSDIAFCLPWTVRVRPRGAGAPAHFSGAGPWRGARWLRLLARGCCCRPLSPSLWPVLIIFPCAPAGPLFSRHGEVAGLLSVSVMYTRPAVPVALGVRSAGPLCRRDWAVPDSLASAVATLGRAALLCAIVPRGLGLVCSVLRWRPALMYQCPLLMVVLAPSPFVFAPSLRAKPLLATKRSSLSWC